MGYNATPGIVGGQPGADAEDVNLSIENAVETILGIPVPVCSTTVVLAAGATQATRLPIQSGVTVTTGTPGSVGANQIAGWYSDATDEEVPGLVRQVRCRLTLVSDVDPTGTYTASLWKLTVSGMDYLASQVAGSAGSATVAGADSVTEAVGTWVTAPSGLLVPGVTQSAASPSDAIEIVMAIERRYVAS